MVKAQLSSEHQMGFSISTGAIQIVIDRLPFSLKPHYAAFGRSVRQSPVNHVDETSWYQAGKLNGLRAPANRKARFFMTHPNRSSGSPVWPIILEGPGP